MRGFGTLVTIERDRLQAIVTAWKHLSSYLRLHKVFRKRGRERKRELFSQTLEGVAQAEQSGDKQSLYSAIRKLAPKAPKQKTQVKGSKGQLLNIEKENQEFLTYCRELFAPVTCQLPDAPMDGESQPFTQEELAKAMKSLSAKKSVPPRAVSMILWKIGAEVVLPALSDICQEIWDNVSQSPALWADFWLVWPPTPGKPANKPSDPERKSEGKYLRKRSTIDFGPLFRTQPQAGHTSRVLLAGV